MGVEDHHEARVVLASPEEIARISEVSGVADGDEGSGRGQRCGWMALLRRYRAGI